ncbi:M48 family metallopeptidase [bacterium]|nr:M48 family metallopeptidase [bacterium]
MKKYLILGLALFTISLACEAKDYTKLHIKEMQKSQKYATSKTYFANYAPQVENNLDFELKDPKLIKFAGYKEITDAQYNAKLTKDNIEYARINKFLITRKIDNYNTQAYGEDFYKLYRITEKLIRANNLDFINWRIVIDSDKEFNASSSDTNCITINTGAFDTLINNEDALALLIGHELAHSLLGHAARKAELYKNFKMALRINNHWYYVYRKRKFFSESRKMEFAADVEGAKLALKAGYDLTNARETISFLNTMGNGSDAYSSHPNPKERVQNFDMNRKYFMDEEWIKQGRYNIYNSSVLDCIKSSDRHSVTIARNGKKKVNSVYQPEDLAQLYLRFGYKSYVNGEFEKSVDYFKDYLNINKNNYTVYLYISYAYEALYKQTGKNGYLDSAREFASYAKTLDSNNKYVKEQILAL